MATADETDGKKCASLLLGSEEDYSLICLPCHRDDTNIPAFCYCIDCHEHLCHQCCKHHKKATPCRHHKLQDKDTMPSTQQLTDTTVHAGTTDNLTTPCPHHKTEMLKLYCKDHDLLLCSICVALEHPKPCTVVYIPQVSGEILNGRFYKSIMGDIENLMKRCRRLKTETSRDITKSNDSLKNALLDIKKYRQDINDRIDELEKETKNKIQALQHQNDLRIKTVETTCEDVMKMVKTMYDNMKQLNTSKQADKLFEEVVQNNKQLKAYTDSILSLSTEDRVNEYEFKPSQAINDVLQHEKMTGSISMKQQRTGTPYTLSATPADGNIIPTFLGEICVKTSDDRHTCNIIGMTAIPPNKLVLVDYNNKSIKLVDVNKKSVSSQLSLGREVSDYPYDITSTTTTQVAVTVPHRQCIQFISVSQKLKMKHKIQTDGECYGICCFQNKLIVTYQDPNKLEILDMEGRVITKMSLESTGEDVIHQPDHAEANTRFIYVSDNVSVIMLNWTGEITGTFGDSEMPTAIAQCVR